MRQKQIISSVALVLVALAWGASYAVFKGALDIIKPYNLMAIRFTSASVILSLIYLPKLIKIKKVDIVRGTIIGIWMFASFWLMAISLQYTTASKQAFMIGSSVVMTPFLVWFFNKIKPDRYDIIGVVLAFIGISMLTFGGIGGINIGDIMSLGSAVSLCMQMIYIQRYCNKSDPVILTIVQFWVTAIIFIILMLLFEPFQGAEVLQVKWSIVYLVVPSTVIAFLVQNIVLKYVTPTSVALIMTLETVFGSIFAVFYLGEVMSTTMVAGCIIVFIGIITKETKLKFLRKDELSGDVQE